MTRTRTSAAKKTADATPAPATARKTAAKKTTTAASRPPRKQTPGAPTLSLVKPRKELPTR